VRTAWPLTFLQLTQPTRRQLLSPIVLTVKTKHPGAQGSWGHDKLKFHQFSNRLACIIDLLRGAPFKSLVSTSASSSLCYTCSTGSRAHTSNVAARHRCTPTRMVVHVHLYVCRLSTHYIHTYTSFSVLSLSHTHIHTDTLLSLSLGVTPLLLARQARTQLTNNAATISSNGSDCDKTLWGHCCGKSALRCIHTLQNNPRSCPRWQGLLQCASIWIRNVRPESS